MIVGENQINEIISSSDAWNISEDSSEEEMLGGLKATVSSRQIKALIEQITGMSLLPSHHHFTRISTVSEKRQTDIQTDTRLSLKSLTSSRSSLQSNCPYS